MIKIGVSPCFLHPDPNRAYFAPKLLNYFENDMANYLTQKDVLPILIPKVDAVKLEYILSKMDGFVFQGGDDLSPKTYGAPFLDEARWPGDEIRDQFEFKILDYAIKNKKPILGICRGAQLLNAYFGGDLYQDLMTQKSDSILHRDGKLYDQVSHQVDLVKGSLLECIYSKENIQVNSVHHQGIKKLGKSLIIEATSPKDHLVEAFVGDNLTQQFILGVQWHPECSPTLGDKVASPGPIYDKFIEVVKNGYTKS